MSQLTLQINSKEALERLIGGDEKVDVDIRNSVVQKFSEKHLKSVANSETIREFCNSLKSSIEKDMISETNSQVGIIKTNWAGQVEKVTLHPAIKTEIDSLVRNHVDELIRKSVDDAIKFWANDAEIEKRVEKRMEYYAEERIKTEVKQRLEDAFKKIKV